MPIANDNRPPDTGLSIADD